MERWAANTLRTVAIILTSGLVIISCLFLILLSMCFGGVSNWVVGMPTGNSGSGENLRPRSVE